MIVTLEVGPRIIRFGRIGGPNEFVEYAKDMGKSGGDEYHSYGGHRLWIAPEEAPKTTTPDNESVMESVERDWHVFTAAVEPWHVQKEIRIKAQGDFFLVEHRIYNRGVYSIELAPWALTVMALGGECVWPQAPYVPQPQQLLPVRPIALWSYTNMSDPRWTWGRRTVRLRQTFEQEPQKVGCRVEQGIAGYANHGNFYFKRFPYMEGANYPDFGCNFETFTRHDMLEVESLGPLQAVAPGAYASHLESHHLLLDTTPPADDDACADFLLSLVQQYPLPNLQ